MNTYTIFDGQSIRRNISGNEETLHLNVQDGESWVEGYFTDDLFYVDGGAIVPFPEKPVYPCVFDKASKSWAWDEQTSWAILRQERQEKLAASDWTQVPDAPVDQAAWAEYRQALRDLPANTTDPRNPNWPTTP